MKDRVNLAVDRLAAQLPLQDRQSALPEAYASVHRQTLRSLASLGRPLDRDEIAALLPDGDVDEADFQAFAACRSGPGIPADPACDD